MNLPRLGSIAWICAAVSFALTFVLEAFSMKPPGGSAAWAAPHAAAATRNAIRARGRVILGGRAITRILRDPAEDLGPPISGKSHRANQEYTRPRRPGKS